VVEFTSSFCVPGLSQDAKSEIMHESKKIFFIMVDLNDF